MTDITNTDILVSQADLLGNLTHALTEQAVVISWRTASVDSLGKPTKDKSQSAVLLHFLIIGILGDRLMGLQHKPTIRWFCAAITFNWLMVLWNVAGNEPSIVWFFEYQGSAVHYWVQGFLSANYEGCVSYLSYLRISSSIDARFGRTWDFVGRAIVCGVLPVELAKQWYEAATFTITEDYDGLYQMHLIYISIAYRISLDVAICAYSVWIVHEAATGFESMSGGTARVRQDRAVFLAYAFRVLLFMGVDCAYIFMATWGGVIEDISFPGLVVWKIWVLLMPWKAYLLITDMARVRALTEEDIPNPPPPSVDLQSMCTERSQNNVHDLEQRSSRYSHIEEAVNSNRTARDLRSHGM
ncbi:hypothetical protein DFJ77DRAFT_471813 [Powellomyces hirtus]|nr:hypothetical protein DFJ77DRAFT_471813 [Powellomyces hirtus]